METEKPPAIGFKVGKLGSTLQIQPLSTTGNLASGGVPVNTGFTLICTNFCDSLRDEPGVEGAAADRLYFRNGTCRNPCCIR